MIAVEKKDLQSQLQEGHSHRTHSQWELAIAIYEHVFHQAGTSGDIGCFIEAALSVAHALREGGRLEEAVEQYELVITMAGLHNDGSRRSRALNGLGIVYQETGDIQAAVLSYSEAASLANEIRDRLGIANIQQNLGTLETTRGNRDAALHYYRAAITQFEALGYYNRLAGVLNNLGMLHVDAGQFGDAHECYSVALQHSSDANDLQARAVIVTNVAEMYYAEGDLKNARSWCDEAHSLSCEISNDRTKADSLKLYGLLCARVGRPRAAERFLRRAVSLARLRDNALTEAESLREYAGVLRTLGRNSEALEALNRAHILFERIQAPHEKAAVARQVQRLEAEFLAVATTWGESIEAKDEYTNGHSHRVAEYACIIGEAIGFLPNERFWLRIGAFLHDIGKTQIPSDLLNKSGELTQNERRLIESHTVIGDSLLAGIPFPYDLRSMVRSHHERWDGGGYPDGLAGEAIPLSARIISYADVFDALTTARSYRGALSFDNAIQMMKLDKGALDPSIFPYFERSLPKFADVRARLWTSLAPRPSLDA